MIEELKDTAKWLLVLVVFTGLIWFITDSWKPKDRIIKGHDYIEYPEMDGVELIHSPECRKCKRENK